MAIEQADRNPSAVEAIEELATWLAVGLKNISFYDIEHRVVRDALTSLHQGITRFLEEAPEFVIKFVDGYVVAQDTPLLSRRASLGNLVGACHRRSIEAITVERGVTLDEVRHFVSVLSTD